MSYTIELNKLNLGVSTQNFKIENVFFEKFNYSEIKNANIDVVIKIETKTSSISLDFEISGVVEVECDICLENFNFEINTHENLFIRFSDRHEGLEEELEDDNKITLSKSEKLIDLSKHLFDFIILSMPIKKTHPLDSDGERTCNPEFLLKLEELEYNTNNNKDPRWDKLKELL